MSVLSCARWSVLGISLAALCAAPSVTAREVVARVGGEPVYADEVEPRIAFQLYRLRSEIHRLLVREAEAVVEERLLEAEAARRGFSSAEELLRSEAEAKLTAVTEAEVDAYLAEHPASHASPQEARERVAAYLAERRRIELRLELVAALKEANGFELVLRAPEAPRTEVEVAGAPGRGPERPAVTIVHFADFNDPASAASAAVIRELAEEHPGQIREVYRPYFRMHDELALRAAELALVSQDAGRFWEWHDRLMELGGKLDGEKLDALATELGVTLSEEREPSLLRLKAALAAAGKAGVTHTPVLFVNGRYLSGTFPLVQLRRLVREELSASLKTNETAAPGAGGFKE